MAFQLMGFDEALVTVFASKNSFLSYFGLKLGFDGFTYRYFFSPV